MKTEDDSQFLKINGSRIRQLSEKGDSIRNFNTYQTFFFRLLVQRLFLKYQSLLIELQKHRLPLQSIVNFYRYYKACIMAHKRA